MTIHLLILLMTLNTLFPSAVLASMCAPSMSTTNMGMALHAQPISSSDTQASDQPTPVSNTHCHHPDKSPCDMPCCDESSASAAHSKQCDSSCCDSGLTTTAVLTALPLLVYSHCLSLKPVSGDSKIFTQSISPELRPPLA